MKGFNIPKLNIQVKRNDTENPKASTETESRESEGKVPSTTKNIIVPTLNMKKKSIQGEVSSKRQRVKDFQDEFMENYDQFSESWREAIRKQKRF